MISQRPFALTKIVLLLTFRSKNCSGETRGESARTCLILLRGFSRSRRGVAGKLRFCEASSPTAYSAGKLNFRVRKLRGNVDADRYVGAFFLAIGYISVSTDSQGAFYGRILVDMEGHSLGCWVLL